MIELSFDEGGDLFARLIFFTTATNYFFFVFRIYHHFFRHFGLFVLVFYSLWRKSAFFFFLPVLVSHLRFSVNTVYFVLEVPFHGSFYHGVSGSVHCLLSSSMDERLFFELIFVFVLFFITFHLSIGSGICHLLRVRASSSKYGGLSVTGLR